MKKAVVLLSGGLDSAVTAAVAKHEGHELYLLTISYGQRHRIEVMRARQIAKWLEAKEHKIIELDLRAFGGSALTGDLEVPTDRTSEERDSGIPQTYVPARNTIFLSLALAYAEVLQATTILFGANIRDYSGYPDCRPEYVQAFKEMARRGTKLGADGQDIEILTPLIFMTKADIIRKGAELGVPFQFTHSCYAPHDNGRICGRCDSCLIRREGFEAAGVQDPALKILSPWEGEAKG